MIKRLSPSRQHLRCRNVESRQGLSRSKRRWQGIVRHEMLIDYFAFSSQQFPIVIIAQFY